MAVSINSMETPAVAGLSLFDHAERVGVTVPTSCNKQGKCRECIVEVVAGAEALSERTEEERHLGEKFRLSCRARVVGDGEVRCHTMRRGNMRIEVTGRLGDLPHVARQGHGVAMDLGTTTIVLRLYKLENGELMATTSLENPQRFGG